MKKVWMILLCILFAGMLCGCGSGGHTEAAEAVVFGVSDNSILGNNTAEIIEKTEPQAMKSADKPETPKKEGGDEHLDILIRLINARSYRTAMQYYRDNTFRNELLAGKYCKFAEANAYYQSGLYGFARRLLTENCGEIPGSTELIEEIDEITSGLEGVYVNTGAGYYGMFCVINHGMVCLHTDMGGELDEEMYYNYSLSEREYDYGGTARCITDITGTITYYILDEGGDSFTLQAREGYEYHTFNGYFVKTDEAIPKQKG